MQYAILAVILGTAITAGHAADRQDLPELVAAFVTAERPDADAERHAAIAACLLSAFEGIPDGELADFLDEEDFEDSMERLVMAHPEREEIIEVCEDL